MADLVDVGASVRSADGNPWFDRLRASVFAKAAGVEFDFLVEQGTLLTKVEKRVRLMRRSRARYLCILEDDTEVLHDGWLLNMVSRMSSLPNVAVMNPAETRVPPEDVPPDALADETQEVVSCAGFCMLIDRMAGLEPDVRVQTLDDLWLSLAARARGWRCARTAATLVRHSKQPWASDDLAPWEQGDRSRFGEGDAYYERDRHEAKRRWEARLMVEQFGDLARLTLPPELLPWADPLHKEFSAAWDRGMPVDYQIETRRLVAAGATGLLD